MEENNDIFSNSEDIDIKNIKVSTISEQIGEDFKSYLDKSTVYYYAENIEEFNIAKKDMLKKIWLHLAISFIPAIVLIIYVAIKKDFFILELVAPLFFPICPIIDLVYIYQMKEKMSTKSSKLRYSFEYSIFNDYLETKESKTSRYQIELAINTGIYISLFAVIVVNIWLFNSNIYIFLSQLAVIAFNGILFFKTTDFETNTYTERILETEDSYILVKNNKFKRVKK